MKRSAFFWGAVIILLGALLLLQNFGILNFSIWPVFWATLLILLGLWFILAPVISKRVADVVEEAQIPYESASSMKVEMHHGAGRVVLNPLDNPSFVMTGKFIGGLEKSLEHQGDQLVLKMRTPSGPWTIGPWWGGRGLEWDFALTSQLPLDLVLKTGASEAILNLEKLNVKSIVVDTGASSTEIHMPASAGVTSLKMTTGAASMKVYIPEGVAARIKVSSGLSGINIASRFPKTGEYYESLDFASAVNKAEITVDTGVASLEIM
jgi:hypothetical protein